MKIGLQVPNFTWPGGPASIAAKLAEIAAAADEAGFASLWVMDHFFQIGAGTPVGPRPAEDEMLEGYSVLSYLAGFTKNVKLGHNGYRRDLPLSWNPGKDSDNPGCAIQGNVPILAIGGA